MEKSTIGGYSRKILPTAMPKNIT